MPSLIEALAGAAPSNDHQLWPGRIVDAPTWCLLGERLGEGCWTLAGLWGAADAVHMAVLDSGRNELVVATLPCPTGQFPSIARHHAPAYRLERTVSDLFGLEPVGNPDDRRWLDHGQWGARHPLGSPARASTPTLDEARPYPFLTAEGEGLHQIAVGPVHAGTIEPGHFRFTANGETIVRLEERFGYAHKGVESLMAGAPINRAVQLAARVSGDSTVAYSIAFARTVEGALGLAVPERAHWLRALMAELERIANHLGDIGAVCNDAAFALMHAHTAVLRERVLRLSQGCFGHRLMMDKIVPGGVTSDLDGPGADHIRSLLAVIGKALPQLIRLYDETASLQNRTVGAGMLSHGLAQQYGCGGFIGRASGRAFDTRRDFAYPPYDRLRFEVPVFQEGDVNARVWVRIREVEQSLGLIDQILSGMPSGEFSVPVVLTGQISEGISLVEGFRGDILCWLRLAADGTVGRCHLRDPSWFQWPLLEAAIEGNIVADFPLCNKSFNCSYSGHDL